jgi:hypothetical protein
MGLFAFIRHIKALGEPCEITPSKCQIYQKFESYESNCRSKNDPKLNLKLYYPRIN